MTVSLKIEYKMQSISVNFTNDCDGNKLDYNNDLGEGTLPWAIFRFRIFSNYSQKFEKIKITV